MSSSFRSPLHLLTLALVALVACQSAAPAPQEPAASAAPVPTTLRVIQGNMIDTLDPHRNTRQEAWSVLGNLMEGLVGRDPKTMKPAPALATSWTTPDPTTWLFKLRSGVTFHNGEPLNAAAVKFNFDRVLKPDLGSAIGTSLTPLLAAVEAIDESTVRIATKAPTPWFLERIARFYFVPPKETTERGNDYVATHPVGTGPYKFVEWKTGQSIAITRNDAYWGTKPVFANVTFRQILEPATAIAELLAGTADVVESIPPDQVAAVTGAGMVVASSPTQIVWEVGFDAMARGGPTPFTDVRVRQAANYAVDREAIAKNLLGGYSKALASWLNPLAFGYDASLQPYPVDLAKAKQLLAEAGHVNGFDTSFTIYPISSSINHRDVAQAVANDLAKVGIRAAIKQVSITEATTISPAGQNGPMILRGNPCAGSFDANLCLNFLAKSSRSSYFNSDQLEDLLGKAAVAPDPAERLRLYAQAQKLVQEQAPMIAGWSGFYLSALTKKVDYAPSADSQTRAFLAKPK
jgi:peptide/nickel transport system substrate-binding protein